MQCTENGPVANTAECEKMLGQVAEDVLAGGYTGQGFCENQIQFMKNIQLLCTGGSQLFGGEGTVWR